LIQFFKSTFRVSIFFNYLIWKKLSWNET
jgi:hypothetical protein